MKKCLLMLLAVCTFVTPAVAAPAVYFKDGGILRAQKVWREQGRVYVLVNRDTLTDFSPAEIDLKRTFARKPRAVKKQETSASLPKSPATALPGAEGDAKKPDTKTKAPLRESLKLPEKTADGLVPSSGSGGTIKQRKKELAEKAGE